MHLRKLLLVILTLCTCFISSQNTEQIEANESMFLVPEILTGLNVDRDYNISNDLQLHLFLSVGKYHNSTTQEWATRLNYPKTGLSIGYSYFGNSNIGEAFSVFPFIEIDVTDRLHLIGGLGLAYINTIYDRNSNPTNTSVSSHFNGTFKMVGTYDLLKSKHTDWRIGLTFLHYSNGRTKTPNNGLNSALVSISAKIDAKREFSLVDKPQFDRSTQSYFSARFGLGFNAISEEFNDTKTVYTFAPSYGKIVNRTFKFGVGFYYRLYQHYYDYINDEKELITTDYSHFLDNPVLYASTLGLFGSFELLLGHVGIEVVGGVNILKPFYSIDYLLNQGEVFENTDGSLETEYADLDIEYDLKRTISGRLGLKYYLYSNNDAPKHNWYLGGHINSNLGQADFMEISIGYVYRFSKK